MKMKTKLTALAVAISAQLIPFGNIAIAQEESAEKDQEVELIMVTGSFVRRSENFESPSPLAVLDAGDIDSIGAKSIADITQTLTINTGAENTPDAFTQNATAGTSNINLRGLGVASTLILLNNKRQVVNAQNNNGGVNFVDTSSLVPMIAIDRMEVVKDGASALYGSDAVAGVVNFITKTDYEGAQVSLDYQDGAHGDNKEYNLQGLWGAVGDDSSILAAISYTNRSPLFTRDRRISRPQDDASSLGNPGSYFIGATPFIDPTGCAEYGGLPTLLAPPGTVPGLDVGLCRFDFGNGFSFVPDESRVTTYVKATKQLTENIEWTTEITSARNRAERGGSPSFPILTFPTVPANHPNNVFGQDVSYFGREVGNDANGNALPGDPANTESDTFRFMTMVQGELEDGFWEVSYTAARNDFLFTGNDTLAQEFQNALRGFGGQGCDPIAGVAGEGACEYFNPFATQFTSSPNSQNVIDSFTGRQSIDSESNLEVAEAFLSTELFEMDGGVAGIAVGVQYRYQDLFQDHDSQSNQDKFAFVIGNPDIGGEQDVVAVFGELALPVSDDIDIQIALRYEDYGGSIGDTIDPKLAVSWRATDDFSLRASVSTSFRAPSIFQRDGGGTGLNQVSDPITGGTFFAAVRSSGNEDLVPEESTAFNVGFSFEPVDDLSIEVDYWSFDFTNLITQESFQAILNAEPQNPDRVVRVGDPLNGPIIRINTTYVNANSLETSGLDLVANYKIDTDMGTFTPNLSATYILAYDLVDPQAGQIDGVGSRNYNNIGTSTPELKANFGLNWTHENYSANIFARHIDSYTDDQNDLREIESHLTWDAQLNIDLGGLFETDSAYILTFGGVNLTDQDPPQVYTNGGFDSKVHDPRGRQVYARLAIEF